MIGRMNEPPLRPGDLVKCPQCRRWHPVVKWHREGTANTLRMLYFDCRGKRYYAGQQDLESRHETKHRVCSNLLFGEDDDVAYSRWTRPAMA